jgi:hypothetical protein
MTRSCTLLCILGLAAGCSSVGPDTSTSVSAARRFHEALADNQHAVACGLLAPRTRMELEQSAEASCPKALADAGIPAHRGAGTSTVALKVGS